MLRPCNVDHKRLLDLLAEQIDDPIFLDPIQKYLRLQPLVNQLTEQPFQTTGLVSGAVLFPIPTNVVLHRLDVFALSMCREQDIYYVRFADYLAIGIARSYAKAGETRYKLTYLVGLQLRAIVIRTAALHRVPMTIIKVQVPMRRVIPRLKIQRLLFPI